MKISELICSPGKSGFFFDDKAAIGKGAVADGNIYLGEAITPGFKNVRQAGESISIMLVLEDGQIAYGDCSAVQYSGAAGRDNVFLVEDYKDKIEVEVRSLLVDKEITTFKKMSKIIDEYRDSSGNKLHTAIRYGVSQAILDAVAKTNKKLMAEVIAEEYNTTISETIIPIFTQSGDNRYDNADKMILKSADVLPHALINHVEDKLGLQGEKLISYVKWLVDRINKVKVNESYAPIIHLDVYGTFGVAFNNDLEKIADYMKEIEDIVSPLKLRIESPVDLGSREKQIEALAELRLILERKGINVEIVIDEWCNTYEDVIEFTDKKAGHIVQVKSPDLGSINNIIESLLYCKKNGMGAYLGGSCNETERSGIIGVHIAMATCPIQYLAKPGMGVDEAYMITFNEMQRIIALRNYKK